MFSADGVCFGHVNTIEAAVKGGALLTPLGAFSAPASAAPGPAIVCVRPQHLLLETGGAGVRATVTGVTCVGDVTEVQLRVDDLRLVARVPDGRRSRSATIHACASIRLIFLCFRSGRNSASAVASRGGVNMMGVR